MDETPAPAITQPNQDDDSARSRPFPVVLHLGGAPCLVVGGGPVAARKARGLVDAGAHVTLVAPTVLPGLAEAALDGGSGGGTLAVERRAYRSPEAGDYRVVVSATGDPAVDALVTADGLRGGALVNRAATRASHLEPASMGTIDLPAVHRDGPVTVAVSTDASSPALATWLRDRAAAALGPDLAVLAGLVAEARRNRYGPSAGAVDWHAALDRVAPLVADGRVDEARSLLAELIGSGTPEPAKSDGPGQ